jgi:hypothetical protein
MDRLSNSVSMVTQLWKLINLRNPEDRDDTFSETSAQTSTTWYKSQKASLTRKHVSENEPIFILR